MPPPDQVPVIFATDESLAIKAGSDFIPLCPSWQRMAFATDGVFNAGSPWILNSATVDFATAGVQANHMIWIKGPSSFVKGSGDLLAIESVSSSSLTLRRVGLEAGKGKPIGPTAGVTGVTFEVPYFDPQIEEASWELYRRYGVDPNLQGRSAEDLYDPRDLRMACILLVIVNRMDTEVVSRDHNWALKLERYQNELSDLQARLQVRWNSASGTYQPPTGLQGRVSR